MATRHPSEIGTDMRASVRITRLFAIVDLLAPRRYPVHAEQIRDVLKDIGIIVHRRTIERDCVLLHSLGIIRFAGFQVEGPAKKRTWAIDQRRTEAIQRAAMQLPLSIESHALHAADKFRDA